MRKQKGFTLIELIIVMVILGILAAFAIPRFFDFGSSARKASINSLLGSVNSASSIGHAAALANNQTATTATTITMDNTAVTFINGYPDGSATGIGAAVNAPTTTSTTPAAGQYTFAAGNATTPATWTIQANCLVSYTQAGVNGTPTITSTISGC